MTINGFFPPHSKSTLFKLESAEYRRNILPVSVEPVKATQSTSGCSPNALPTVSPKPQTTLITPSGIPASAANSAMRIVDREVCSAGFRTTVFPVARIGPNFQAAIIAGKFQGRIAATTPIGSRTIIESTLGSLGEI